MGDTSIGRDTDGIERGVPNLFSDDVLPPKNLGSGSGEQEVRWVADDAQRCRCWSSQQRNVEEEADKALRAAQEAAGAMAQGGAQP